MPRALSLGLALFALWLVLSGHLEPLMLTLGVLSVAWAVRIALRMDVVDHEGHPVHMRFLALIGYWFWLAGAIGKSGVEVARYVLIPGRRVSPVVVRVPTGQRTTIGRVVYANSITLTPGTVSIDLGADSVTVHALTSEGAAALASGDMGRRVAAVEGVH